ncbi:hypothetical protein DERF_012201, partial [Dermatophagoides farinae]
ITGKIKAGIIAKFFNWYYLIYSNDYNDHDNNPFGWIHKRFGFDMCNKYFAIAFEHNYDYHNHH